MAEALLDIQTVIERPMVKIDGDLHEIMSPEELPLLTTQKIASLSAKLNKLMKVDNLDSGQEKQLERVLAKLNDIILEPVPDDVRAKLSEAQQMAVIEVFTMLLLERKTKLAGGTMVKQLASGLIEKLAAAANQPQSNGEKSSSGSSASTEATHGDG